MKRKIMAVLLVVVMVAGLSVGFMPFVREARANNERAALIAYREMLMMPRDEDLIPNVAYDYFHPDRSMFVLSSSAGLFDFDNDGVPELLISHFGWRGSHFGFAIVSYTDQINVIYDAQVGGDGGQFFSADVAIDSAGQLYLVEIRGEHVSHPAGSWGWGSDITRTYSILRNGVWVNVLEMFAQFSTDNDGMGWEIVSGTTFVNGSAVNQGEFVNAPNTNLGIVSYFGEWQWGGGTVQTVLDEIESRLDVAATCQPGTHTPSGEWVILREPTPMQTGYLVQFCQCGAEIVLREEIPILIPVRDPFAEYIHDDIREEYIFIPPPAEELLEIADAETAEEIIIEAVTALTDEQRASGEALNVATVYLENVIRRGATREIEGDALISAAVLQELTDTAQDIRQTTDYVLETENVELMRDLRTNINIVTDVQEELVIAFPDDVQDVEFDNVTIEADFAAITVNREFIEAGNEVNVRMLSAAGNEPPVLQGNIFAMDMLLDFWAAFVILFLLIVWLILSRAGKKLRLWVVPTFTLIAVAANAYTFFFLESESGDDYYTSAYAEEAEEAEETEETAAIIVSTLPEMEIPELEEDAVLVNMTDGMLITLSLPVNGYDPDFLVLFDENGEPLHSRHNPVTDTIDSRVRQSGVYFLRENVVSFADIEGKSIQMQDAILWLSSRGIMDGTTETYFSPDDAITRAEFVATMIRGFDMLDLDAQTTFIDVNESDWYYHAVATAQQTYLIAGFGDGTFRGHLNIAKDQLVVASARSLITQMGYRIPDNTEEILARFADRELLAHWSEYGIALATMSNILIHRADNLFAPHSAMTRGDAAVVLHRVFNRIW